MTSPMRLDIKGSSLKGIAVLLRIIFFKYRKRGKGDGNGIGQYKQIMCYPSQLFCLKQVSR